MRMRHRNAFRKLGRTSSHRWAMLRTMVTQLLEHERIETTVAKAKELRRVADNVVQLGKDGSLAARREAAAIVRGDAALQKLFSQMAARYKDRAGGYTRVLLSRVRTGDAATMAWIEFVDRPNELRQSKPPRAMPPERAPLPPWVQARHARSLPPPRREPPLPAPPDLQDLKL